MFSLVWDGPDDSGQSARTVPKNIMVRDSCKVIDLPMHVTLLALIASGGYFGSKCKREPR